MKLAEVADMIRETGMPTAYLQYPNSMVPKPPYTVYYFPNSDNFGADDTVYVEINALNIELYTTHKSVAAEKRIEKVLEDHEIFWEKTEAYLDSEHLYEVLYEMEIIFDGE